MSLHARLPASFRMLLRRFGRSRSASAAVQFAFIAPLFFGLLFSIIETALLAPDGEQWLDASPEPLLHYVDGEARIALFSPAAWRARYAPDANDGGDRLERRFEHFQARQRQFAAVLGAHGVPVTFAHCAAGAESDL